MNLFYYNIYYYTINKCLKIKLHLLLKTIIIKQIINVCLINNLYSILKIYYMQCTYLAY